MGVHASRANCGCPCSALIRCRTVPALLQVCVQLLFVGASALLQGPSSGGLSLCFV